MSANTDLQRRIDGLDGATFPPLSIRLLAFLAICVIPNAGCQLSNFGNNSFGKLYSDAPLISADHVQYYPAGAEFKCSREAAALKSIALEAEQDRASRRGNTSNLPGQPANSAD